MVVKKTGASFVCYLLDFGNMVTISQTMLRPLPTEFLTKPPCAFQVNENLKENQGRNKTYTGLFGRFRA